MPHPIFGPVEHRLDRVDVSLWLPSARNNRQTRVEAHGRSETSRADLWSYRELWSWSEQQNGLQPVDSIQHVLLVASQDRPGTQGQFQAYLTGQERADMLPMF